MADECEQAKNTLTTEVAVTADIDSGDDMKDSGAEYLRIPARSWGIPDDENVRLLMAMLFAEHDAHAKATRRAMFDLLKSGGYDLVEVDYDGYGDSGQVQAMTFFKGGTGVPADDRVAAETYLYANLPGGWEINGGCYGTARVYPASEYTAFDHTERAEHFVELRDGVPGADVPDDDR
jgi:hypothetical protein